MWWEAPDDEYGVLYRLVMMREGVRRRPGMYIGGTDVRALHHTIYQVLDNAVEEAIVGECTQIEVVLLPDGSACIKDNSQGLPVDTHQPSNKSKLELLFTQLHLYKDLLSSRELFPITGGLHGLGLSAINMLSEWMIVEVARDGYLWQQNYSTGVPRSPVRQVRPLATGETTGTTITFKPDATIFAAPPDFEYERIARRCREVSYQIAALTMIVRDERETPHREERFYAAKGLESFVNDLRQANEQPLHDIIHYQTVLRTAKHLNEGQEPASLWIEFAVQFTQPERELYLGFVNTVNTPDGGTHVDALHRGIIRGLNKHLPAEYARFKYPRDKIGTISVISVRLVKPEFVGPTKVQLGNPEIVRGISHAVGKSFDAFAATHPDQMQRIIEHCIANRAARSS
jgi:DNA gyrase subunit B